MTEIVSEDYTEVSKAALRQIKDAQEKIVLQKKRIKEALQAIVKQQLNVPIGTLFDMSVRFGFRGETRMQRVQLYRVDYTEWYDGKIRPTILVKRIRKDGYPFNEGPKTLYFSEIDRLIPVESDK